jgi:hypothetical protein
LAIGVYPDVFLNPISQYIDGMFADYPGVLDAPQSSGIIEPISHETAESTAGSEMTEPASDIVETAEAGH